MRPIDSRSPRPRVALFIRHLAGGGAERVMANLANQLAARGCHVDLVLAQRNGPYLQEVADAVEIVDLGAGRLSRAVLPLASYLRRARPAALLSTLVHSNIAAVLASRMARVSTRLVLREVNPVRGTAWLLRVASLTYRRADRIIAPSQGVAREVAEHHGVDPERIETIYNPVDISMIDAAVGEDVGTEWYAEGQRPVLLNAGRLAPQKDHTTLMKAFALVREKRPARLVILGDGPLRSDLERLARSLGVAEDVVLPGFVANPYAHMARADAFVLSSRWEGCSNVLIEAMACGTPVVATDCPYSPHELLMGGRLGPLTPVGDERSLARAMCDVLDAPRTAKALRRRAEAFTIDVTVQRYLDVLLGSRG